VEFQIHIKTTNSTQSNLTEMSNPIELVPLSNSSPELLNQFNEMSMFLNQILNVFGNTSKNWNFLSSSPFIDIEFIENHIEFPWNFGFVSQNPNLTWNFIETNLFLKWDWIHLSQNQCVTLDIFNKFSDLPWNTFFLANNPNFPSSFSKKMKIFRLADKWEKEIVEQENWDWDFIKKNIDKVNWMNVSKHKCITMDIIEENRKFPWDWNGIFINPNLTWDFIKKNIDKVNWMNVSKHKCITIDIIDQNPELPWDWNNVSENPNLTWDFIQENNNKNWNVEKITKNKSLFILIDTKR
jgi:hypothetical protein